MQFDSFVFAVFLAVVFPLYFLLRHRFQNYMLLVASYVFYGWWDWRFLSLLAISTFVDFFAAIGLETVTGQRRRRLLLLCSMTANLGILGFFKYFNFFAENFQGLLSLFGIQVGPFVLEILLPAGISFYTFQTMSYTIDVYYRRLAPTRNILDFALFVSFFPQLVAGPIERASHLLPQIANPRQPRLAGAYEGAWLIFWGLYKKIFIADNIALLVDRVYAAPGEFSAPMISLATYAFAFQIYCDFSAYTDIARGCARILGFDLMHNFNLPYFATDPQDFWRRWHISLSRWLRDYLYIPLGGSKCSKHRMFLNLMLTMTLGGLWHGATWNFVLWGIYHGLLLVIYRLIKKDDKPADRGQKFLQIFLMFHWTCIGWMLFRAENTDHIFDIVRIFATDWIIPAGFGHEALALLGYIALLLVMQLAQYLHNDLLVQQRFPRALRVLLYIVIYFSITLGGAIGGREFIYFQF